MAKAGSSWKAEVRGAAAVHGAFTSIRKSYGHRATWVVGTNVEYSVYVEFGTSRMSAQPYLRPAVEHAKRNSGKWFASTSGIDEFVQKMALEIEAHAKRNAPVDTGNLKASIRAEKLR